MLISFGALFAVTLLAVNVVRLFGVPFTTYSGSYDHELSQVVRNLDLVADLKKDRFLLWMEERRNDTEALSRNRIIVSSLPGFQKEIQESLESGEKGEALRMDMLKKEGYQPVFQRLRLIKNTHSVYQKIQIADTGTGLILASTDEAEVGVDTSGKPYFLEAGNLTDEVLVSIESDQTTGRCQITFSKMMHDHGNPAVVMLFVDADAFVKPMLYTSGGLGESGEVVLVNQNAQVLLPPKHALRDGSSAKVLETRINTKPVTLAAEGKEGALIGEDYRGVPVLAAYRNLKIMPGVNWGMVVKMDRAEVLAQLWQRVLSSMILSLAGLVGAGVLAIFIAGRLTRPIEGLSDIAQRVEAGDLSARARAKGSREVEALSGTFNSMIERIQGWHAELEEQVTARTAELTAEIIRRKRLEADLAREKERLAVTLRSIGDGVISTDIDGKVVSLNGVAEHLTGWTEREALGKPLGHVFHIINEMTRQPCENPVGKVLSTGLVIGLANHTALISRDRTERVISDSGAPIRDEEGHTIGVVLVFRDVTESRLAQKALRRSERKFRTLFDTAQYGISLTSPNGRLIDANQSLLDLFGYAKEEFLQMDMSEVYVNPADREKFRAAIERHGSVKDFEVKLLKKDGTELNCLLTSTAQRGADGVIIRYQNNIRDISDQKRMYEALRFERSQLLSIFDSVEEIIEVIDPRTHEILYANDFAKKLYGRELVGGLCYKEFDGRESPCDFCNNAALLQGEAMTYQRELHNPTLDRDYVVMNRIIRWPDGRDAKLAFLIDITDRHRTEEALRESEQRFRAVFNSDHAVMLIIDPETGRIEDGSPGACSFYGYSRDDLRKKRITEINVLSREQIFENMRIAKIRKSNYFDFQHRLASGEIRDVEVCSGPIVVGGRTLLFSIISDVTERKRLEKQLAQAQKMEAIGTLAGGIAHDFNNLLTVTSGYAQLLLQGKEHGDSDYEDIQRIFHASKRGAELVRHLLTFSRKVETRPRPMNLNHEVEQVKKLLARTIPKMIAMELRLAGDLRNINADPGQMEQVLMNLAVNAKDAMPDGGVLTVETLNATLDEAYSRTHLGAAPGEYVILSISDTGHGMAKETLDHIFEPFFTTKEAGKGTGLGLATAYGIVKQHGGYITCYSEPGAGTTFKICLPAVEPGIDKEVTAPQTMPAFGTETVLLVDDDDFVRDVGKKILVHAGYTVLTACNGGEALEVYRIKKDKISLVILDLIMPEMGGRQCLERILKIDPSAKVLIASGLSAEGTTKEVTAAGARGFVGKPYDMRQMLASVREVLDAN